jgi:hypothetical protein
MSWNRCRNDELPDARDGLTRLERVILYELQRAEQASDGRRISSAELYGRVVEHINLSVPEFQRTLRRLTGR